MARALIAMAIAMGSALFACDALCQEIESEADLPERPVAPSFSIESKIGGGPWQRRTAVAPLATDSVALRIPHVDGADVRWYLVFPDLSKVYANANPPWSEKDPYKWVGVARIDYYRVELTDQRRRRRWRSERRGYGPSRRPLSPPRESPEQRRLRRPRARVAASMKSAPTYPRAARGRPFFAQTW
jgi:hypothetical protein